MADLIGRWEKLEIEMDVRESLILQADQRFIQVFEVVGDPARRDEGQGTWHLEQRPSGCVYLHLEGMRYWYGSEAMAVNGNRYEPGGTLHRFWEKCEQHYMTLPDKVILTVTDRPRLPRGIGLLYPQSDRDNIDNSLYLTADASGQTLPTPTALQP
jgi:hypothetical protein